jgi:hypothetical protein
MKKQLLIIGIIVLLVSVGLSGCVDNSELDHFVGKWTAKNFTNYTMVLIFNSDRTCTIGTLPGRYSLKEKTLVVDLGKNVSMMYDYNFSNDFNTLTLTVLGASQYTIVYTKQK